MDCENEIVFIARRPGAAYDRDARPLVAELLSKVTPFIHPGERVLIKPNWVYHEHESAGLECPVRLTIETRGLWWPNCCQK